MSQMLTCYYILLTSFFLGMITPPPPPLSYIWFHSCHTKNHSARELFNSLWAVNRKSSCECLFVLSLGKRAGSTSVLSCLKSLLLKYCLFWAQTQNSKVSDWAGQASKQANIGCGFVFVYVPNKSNKILFHFLCRLVITDKEVWIYHQKMLMRINVGDR